MRQLVIVILIFMIKRRDNFRYDKHIVEQLVILIGS